MEEENRKQTLSHEKQTVLVVALIFIFASAVILSVYFSVPSMQIKSKTDAPIEIVPVGYSSCYQDDITPNDASDADPDLSVNLNTADCETLCLLPGIGKSTAERIIQYRDENGAFVSVSDLLNVEGIGSNTLRQIKDYLVLEGGDTNTSPYEGGLLNVNTAGVNELVTLPGIGEALANAIVEYRTANGPFHWYEELLEVKGFGEAMLNGLRERITLGEYAAASDYSLFPVNLNTADRDLLLMVPGIGETTADAILEYRDKIGKFDSVDQLLNVKGIGEKKLEEFRKYLALDSESIHERESAAIESDKKGK